MFLLQSTGRSGSTYLRTLLNSHGRLRIDGEIFTPDATPNLFYHFWAEEVRRDSTWLSPERRSALVQNYLRSRQDNSGLTYGTDLKLEHLEIIPWASDTIYSIADQVIVLKRLNVLKQVVSYELMMARLREKWESVHGSSVPKPKTISLDPAHVIAQMRRKVELVRAYEAAVRERQIPYLVVIYEDLASSRCVEVLAELQKFLSVEPVHLSSELVKQNPQPLCRLVANYEEIASSIKASEFAYTLYLPT